MSSMYRHGGKIYLNNDTLNNLNSNPANWTTYVEFDTIDIRVASPCTPHGSCLTQDQLTIDS